MPPPVPAPVPRVFYLPHEHTDTDTNTDPDTEPGWAASSKALRDGVLGSAPRGSGHRGGGQHPPHPHPNHPNHPNHPRAAQSEREWWVGARRVWATIEQSPVVPEYIATLFNIKKR